MHIRQGNSAEIPLPPSLLDDANWLGIAICAFTLLVGCAPMIKTRVLAVIFLIPKYNGVTCRLDCDGHVLHKWRPFTEFDDSGFAKDVTWFLYLPRSGIWLKSWRQCKLARATFSWSSQYFAMQNCALGLVYKKDVDRTSCAHTGLQRITLNGLELLEATVSCALLIEEDEKQLIPFI
ncbi:hypothetical protein M0R45_027679 [Rubus argutus]|uniref:Uncharacterized protein n=1 Tax=Rubus argutus TaxID=59490 RepID=A0AAW1X148_RUBAR